MNSIIFAVVSFYVFTLRTMAQDIKGYTIQGEIEGLDSGTLRIVSSYDYSLIDSATIKHGKFLLKGRISEPRDANILLDEIPYVATLFLENADYTVYMKADPFEYEVRGGELHALKDEFERQVQGYYHGWYGMLRIRNDSAVQSNEGNALVIEKMDSLCAFLQKQIIKHAETFIAKHPDSYVTPSIVMNTYRRKTDLRKLEHHYSRLTDNIRNSSEGNELKKFIAHLVSMKDTGDIVGNFKLKDTRGKTFELKSLLQDNKYVLIDFWATWCAPCIREFPYLKAAYDEFHSSGLEIVGISLDDNELKFLDFLKNNDLPWKQLLDKHGKEVAVKDFNIQSIPANFLIDRDFKIVAYQLRGRNLSDTLRKLLAKQSQAAQ